MTLVTRTPRRLSSWAIGRMTAVPTPPPTQTAWPRSIRSVGRPSGPATSVIASPGRRSTRSAVLLPIDWMISVIVPAAGSASAIVSGMRSAPGPSRTMTNWPGCRICGDPGRLDDEPGDVGGELVGGRGSDASCANASWRTLDRAHASGGPFRAGRMSRGDRDLAAGPGGRPPGGPPTASARPPSRRGLALRPVELLLDVELREAVLHQDATRR